MAGEFTTDMGVLAGIQGLNNRFEWYYGDVEPVNPRPFLNWAHLSEDLWKQRNAENTAWIIRGKLSEPYFGLIHQNMINIIDPLGVPKPYFGIVLPEFYLWCDGRTIGDELSGATARANADTFNLFECLWLSMDNTVLPIQNSDGTAGTRGISALDDFNAHKRLPIPDLRGRTLIGLDNMGGISAGRVTATQADTLGGTGGVENQSLTGDQNGPHTHVLSTNWATGEGSYFRANWGSRNGEYNPTTFSTQSSGSGSPHNNMQPYMALNFIVRY